MSATLRGRATKGREDRVYNNVAARQEARETEKQDGQVHKVAMTEQAQKVRSKAIPEWAEGLYYNKGLFSEVLVYHDDDSLYLEVRGKESGVVRFSFEMLQTLGEILEEEKQDEVEQPDSSE